MFCSYLLFVSKLFQKESETSLSFPSWFSPEHMAPDFVRDYTFLCAVTPVCLHVRAVLGSVMLAGNLGNSISLDTGVVSPCWPSNCNSCSHIL